METYGHIGLIQSLQTNYIQINLHFVICLLTSPEGPLILRAPMSCIVLLYGNYTPVTYPLKVNP